MPGPVIAAFTLLIWGIGIAVFIVFTKFCGGCRKGTCDTARQVGHPDAGKPTDTGPHGAPK